MYLRLYLSHCLCLPGTAFAALSHRKGKKHGTILRTGIVFSAIGMLVGVISGIFFFTTVLPRTLENPIYREQMENIMEDYQELFDSMYGEDI